MYTSETLSVDNALLTIEEVGERLGGLYALQPPRPKAYGWIVAVNLKTEDKFHLTIEEYLHAVICLVEELVPSGPPLVNEYSS
jgi:hypothetical protein